MRLADYVANFIADLGIRHVFGVVGGGAMHLNDAFGHHERIQYVACHHEQSASFAAESYARLNGIGCCLVTCGPGGLNAITGCACAFVDSTPVIFISGQVPTHQMIGKSGVRQMGVQESDIISMVKPITKYAATIRNAEDIRHMLEMAVAIAKGGRPGPVWIDIPLDIQSQDVDPAKLWPFRGFDAPPPAKADSIPRAVEMLRAAKRPVMIVGNGVRLAGAQGEIRTLVAQLRIPVVSSWSAADMVADMPFHIGHCGLFGDRAGNFAVQNADLLLVIGCRLSVPMTGYNPDAFAREANIIMVDIDPHEIRKESLKVALPVCSDAKAFINELLKPYLSLMAWLPRADVDAWLTRCHEWRERYPVVLAEYAQEQ